MTRDEQVNAIKFIAKEGSTKTIVSAIVAACPPLVIFSPVLSFLIGLIIGYAVDKTEIAAFFKYIDLRTNAQASEYEKASNEYALAKKSGDKEKITNAEKNLIAAFKRFAKLNT